MRRRIRSKSESKRVTIQERELIIDPGPADVREFLSTGSTLVDLCLAGTVDPKGKGGIPVGRITEIFGPESSGKSYLAGEICGSAQRQKFDQIHLIDTEDSFEYERAHIFDLDVKHRNFHPHPAGEIRTIEQLMGIYEKKIGFINKVCKESQPGERIAIIIDTVEVLPSEMEASGVDKRGQSRAKALSGGFRVTQADLAGTDAAVVFLNQARQKPADRVEFGHRRIVAFESGGGQAIKHYPSVRIYCEEKEPVKNDKGVIVGVRIWCYIYKSKISPPFHSCLFTLNFTYGIDDILDCTRWLKASTEVLGPGAWYSLPDHKKLQGEGNFVKYIEEMELEGQLVALTRQEWIKFHSVEKRKSRIRV